MHFYRVTPEPYHPNLGIYNADTSDMRYRKSYR